MDLSGDIPQYVKFSGETGYSLVQHRCQPNMVSSICLSLQYLMSCFDIVADVHLALDCILVIILEILQLN